MTKERFIGISDEEIVRSIVQDHRSRDYEELYRRYYPKVVNRCHSFIKNRDLSEDFANDIFSKAYEKLADFKGSSKFATWLYAITYNFTIDYLRSRKNLHYPSWNSEHQIPDIPDESDTDIDQINYDDLMQVLEMIHPEEKALLLMKYQDNLAAKQIAQTLRISEDAVKMRLKRARTRVVYIYQNEYEKEG
jgi:RNA polymerase sigma-70 factor (ECF subfamily)